MVGKFYALTDVTLSVFLYPFILKLVLVLLEILDLEPGFMLRFVDFPRKGLL